MSSAKPDSEALELIAHSQRALYGYIYSLVLSRDEADEILQEANVVLCRKVHEFAGRSDFLTWACSIARLEVLAYRRRAGRDRHRSADDSVLEQMSAEAVEVASTADIRLELLDECKEELSAGQREMIELRYGPGGSVKQLAKDLGRSPSSVSVSLSRIRGRISDCIERKLASEGSQ